MLLWPGYCKQCYSEHWSACIFRNSGFLWVYTQEWDCWIIVPSLQHPALCAQHASPSPAQSNHLRKPFESILSFPTASISGAPFCTPTSSGLAVSAQHQASPHSTWNPALSVLFLCVPLCPPSFHAFKWPPHTPCSPSSTPSSSTYFRRLWTTSLFLHLPCQVQIIYSSVCSPHKTVSCQRTGAMTSREFPPS